MKTFLSLLILFAFFFQTFKKAIIVTEYYTHTKEFARKCINKNKPSLCCNGKCQMLKKIKQEEKKEQQNTDRNGFKDEVISSKNYFTKVIVPISLIEKEYSSFNDKTVIDRSDDLFKPPCSISLSYM